jgi:transcriptional regulator with XRE-family HTH domain
MSKSRIAPVHPGEYLGELLDEIGLSQYRLAQEVGVAPMRISHVVRGQSPDQRGTGPPSGTVLWTERTLLDELADTIRC